MQIVEFPRDVMNASKNIQMFIVVADGMSVSNCGYFALIFESCELIIS